jgi:hypothetical protein
MHPEDGMVSCLIHLLQNGLSKAGGIETEWNMSACGQW